MPMLEQIYASTRAEELAPTGWDDKQKADFLKFQFTAQHDHYQAHYPEAAWLLITLGATPVGRLYIEYWTRELRIIDIALLPRYRGRGWGAAILQDLMDDAAQAQRAVSIHVEKTNPAQRLYKALGFVKLEDKGVYDLMEAQPKR